MKFKLIVVVTSDELTERSIEVAREHGATGATVITNVRGEGLHPSQTFLGLTFSGQRDVILFIVEEHHSREILESLNRESGFDTDPGSGMAFMIDIEDAVGLRSQIKTIEKDISQEEL